MSFSVFFYASLAPKEDSYRYNCRTAFTLLLKDKIGI